MRAWVLLSAVLWYLTGGGDPPARSPGLSHLLRPASSAPPHSEPWLLFYVKSQWFLSSAVGWQRNSERTEKGFIYGNPGHPGNKNLFTRRVCPKSRGSVALLRFFLRRETEHLLNVYSVLCTSRRLLHRFILRATPLRLS